MHISLVDISNFRCLESVSVPLKKFSVLIGENDAGKTAFLCALEKFFTGKKLADPHDWFKENTDNAIRIVLTFKDIPESANLSKYIWSDDTIVLQKVFTIGDNPEVKAILEDGSAIDIPQAILNKWFSQDSFHFIPVRRDLAVQFSMGKTALLGKTLRAQMKETLGDESVSDSLTNVAAELTSSLDAPKEQLQDYLREQLHDKSVQLSFDDLEIDPLEGVSFEVRLSDDRVKNVPIQNRGAGTQNNLIIALFRLIAKLKLAEHFIFAMEEPENSLHPRAQRQLLSVLQKISNRSQVVVTTHSPVFIDRSEFENNVLLVRTSHGNTIAKTFNPSQLGQIRTDLGIRASDALLKGGGNCAILVEGNTEEEGFPIFMEMLGVSEFELGIGIINMGGSDFQTVRNIARLLLAYDIPCVVVLDKDAQRCADDLVRAAEASLTNVSKVICLSKGTIEDYYPLEIVAQVINQEFSPTSPVSPGDFDASKHGEGRLADFKKVMYEHGAGDSMGDLKCVLGRIGTKLLQAQGEELEPELRNIFVCVKDTVDAQ